MPDPWYYDDFATTAEPPVSTTPVVLWYDPVAPAPECAQELVYFVGADLPIRFAPRVPTPIDLTQWEIRLGTRTSPVLNRYNLDAGTLTGVAETGVIDGLVTSAHSAAWPLATFLRCELWRILPVRSLVPHARALVRLLPTARP